MNMSSNIHIERMSADQNLSVSELLLDGFREKFQLKAGVYNTQYPFLLSQIIALDEQSGTSERIVALQGNTVIGSLSWLLPRHSGNGQRDHLARELLPIWKGIRQIGWFKGLQFALRIACLSHRPTKGEMYIADVAVHENLRGAGVGRMMLEWVMREAASKPGIEYMSLHVSSSNIRAKHLYERLGFRTLETQRSTFMGWLLGQQEWNYMIREVRDKKKGM